MDISWSVIQTEITRQNGHDDSADTAFVEGITLDYNNGSPKTGLGSARLREIRPPNFSTLNDPRQLPRFLVDRLHLSAVKSGVNFSGLFGIDAVQSCGNRVCALPI